MLRLPTFIKKNLSVQLSLMVVSAMALLLMASLAIMLHYSRKTVKEEALHKASQTLEGTVQRIDNILLSVEQTTGNFYFNLLPHLDNPDMVTSFCRQIVESNSYIVGCAIAMKPNYYKDHEFFMAYFHRSSSSGIAAFSGSEVQSPQDLSIVQLDSYGNCPYTEQVWFTEPMASSKPGWRNPLKGMDSEGMEPITTFSLPIPGADGKPIGIIGVDVSLSLLSQIVATAKLSANSYCTLLDSDGSFIVHPDSSKLFNQTVFTQHSHGSDPSVKETALSMVSGETGYRPFHMNSTDYLIFYKPFKRTAVSGRSMEKLSWSVGIIYPEDDIFGDYNRLFYYVLVIAIAGLTLLFLLSCIIIHHQLKPLQLLTESAQRITMGHYDETIPDSRQSDEIGRLQNNFQLMQRSLANHIGELELLTATLQERGEGLRIAYNEAQKADRMKTAFLHNMTNQMIGPADTIDRDVCELSNSIHNMEKWKAKQLANDIQQNGNTIAELLKALIHLSDEEMRKEGTHD